MLGIFHQSLLLLLLRFAAMNSKPKKLLKAWSLEQPKVTPEVKPEVTPKVQPKGQPKFRVLIVAAALAQVADVASVFNSILTKLLTALTAGGVLVRFNNEQTQYRPA